MVTLQEVMEQMELGPNGGLLYCMELRFSRLFIPNQLIPRMLRYLLENMDSFKEELGDFTDDYLIIDCPGQIELFSHIPVMKKFIEELKSIGYTVCCVYLLDSQVTPSCTTVRIRPSSFHLVHC